MQEILLNVESKEIRAAHLKHGHLYDLWIDREQQLTGNIYKGRVNNILHNIQSAFVDIDEDGNGFIHISDALENKKKFEQLFDLDFEDDEEGKQEKEEEKVDIEQVLKPDQWVLVQVVKEPMGSKGARLTSNISIAGRYLVLLPNSRHRGVSRKIEDRTAREKLKRFIRSFEMPQDMGLICRTASCLATPDMLIEEAHKLLSTWQKILADFDASQTPALLYQESDIVRRSLLTAIDQRLDRLLIDDYPTYQTCKRLFQTYAAEHPLRIEYYRDKIPMFERFNVEKEIEKALRRKIWLPSGGYLFFDKTEAMHTVDVNSGRSTINQKDKEKNVEETLVRINLEAAEEIARQLRLRNVGGLIIIDFIDMRLKKNHKRVLEKLKECMRDDAAKCMILGMSDFGLVEMTRQRSRGSLAQMMFTTCPYCQGAGTIKTHESVIIEIERALKKAIGQQYYALRLVTHPQLFHHISLVDKQHLSSLAETANAKLEFAQNDNLHLNNYQFYCSINNHLIDG